MPCVNTSLQMDVMGVVMWLLIPAASFLVGFILWHLFKKKPQAKTTLWIIKNDRRIARIISLLSHLKDSPQKNKRNFLFRKKILLGIEMYVRVKSHFPDASPEKIQLVCRHLLLIVQQMKKKRTKSDKI